MTDSALTLEADIERVPFADLSLQWREIAEAARADFDTLFAISSFCLGPSSKVSKPPSPIIWASATPSALTLELPHSIWR